MIPRGYQRRFVDKAKNALKERGDTLGIAATGAGKTICLSFLGNAYKKENQLVLQHRDTLVRQNSKKYQLVNPDANIGYITAAKKQPSKVTFAMVQTLVNNLDLIPKNLGLLIIDEAHRVAADSYLKIIDAIKSKSPKCKIFGVTATPERSDKKTLRRVFTNVCEQITIKELVSLGFLVKPRALVIDAGNRTHAALKDIRVINNTGDQSEVANVLDQDGVHEEVFRKWKEHAPDRRTIIFCANVEHAKHTADFFARNGITTECVHGAMSHAEKDAILKRFDHGEIQVITNVFVLTEGFDSQPVSCVVLLRQCSEKGPMIQMAGRGLRTVNPREYPGIKKKDCLIMDFGTSILTHGDLDQSADLPPEVLSNGGGECPTKICPRTFDIDSPYLFPDPEGKKGCGAELPVQTRTCPLCGFQFRRMVADDDICSVDFTEIDIINASPFRYVDLFGDELSLFATGFEAWAGVFSFDGNAWFALAGRSGFNVDVIGEDVTRIQALAGADDYLRTYETETSAKKSARWLDLPLSDKQGQLLTRYGYNVPQNSITRYAAACHITFQFKKDMIQRVLGAR